MQIATERGVQERLKHLGPPKDKLDVEERAFRFALVQYGQFADHVTNLQSEREVWIRHSILATFAFFGWIAIYSDRVTETFMLGMSQVQAVYFLPFLFNAGGALRFFFIQRDINRHVEFMAQMERETLCLPDEICDAPKGRGLRDRHWHWPSILYWVFITGLSLFMALMLATSGFSSLFNSMFQ